MANRLTDIVAAMKSKWVYGDKDFTYTFEVNENHDTLYPYMMITPPNSEMPEVYGGWEAYNFEIDFFDLYQTAAQSSPNNGIDQRWDNLQDLALEWLDNLMIHFNNPGGANVGVYFLDETLDFERVKEVANDRLVQIKMFFTLRAVTRCMEGNIPMNYYPNQVSDLVIWLRADSGATYSRGTKQVSAWEDSSGLGNSVVQTKSNIKPLRYSYSSPPISGDFLQKPRIEFPQEPINSSLRPLYTFDSLNNAPISSSDFTMFMVTNCTNNPPGVTGSAIIKPVYSYNDGAGGQITVGQGVEDAGLGKNFAAEVKAGGKSLYSICYGVDTTVDNIIVTTLESNTLTVAADTFSTTATTAGFSGTGAFNNTNFYLGIIPGGTWEKGFQGQVAEIIVYNRALNPTETTKIKEYLNNKYKIY